MARNNDFTVSISKQIGNNIRLLRLNKGVSVETLANAIGISKQQLYKYENGINILSTSLLVVIAKILEVSAAYFYKNIEGLNRVYTPQQEIRMELSKNFMKIKDPAQQSSIHKLVKSLASQ